MPKVSGVRARNSIASLMRKTLGQRLDAPHAIDIGSKDRMPQLSVVSPLQRRALAAKSRGRDR